MNVNRVFIGGRVGKIETKYTTSGIAVCSFSVATNKTWKDKSTGEKQEKTTWHNIQAWRNLADFCSRNVIKGARILVVGEIETRSYDDKETGARRYKTDVIAQDIQVIDWPDKEGSVSRENADIPGTNEPFTDEELDIPF